MPLIIPPNNNNSSKSEEFLPLWQQYRRVELFLNIQPWKCHKCGIINFGRNKLCVGRNHASIRCDAERPKNFVLQNRNASIT